MLADSDGTKKADILSRQFAFVFNRDSGESQARLYVPNYPAMKPLTIDQNRVGKLLQGLNVGKTSGLDSLPCCLLKEPAQELVLHIDLRLLPQSSRTAPDVGRRTIV